MPHRATVPFPAPDWPDPETFLLSKPQLLARRSYKWRQYPADVIAACVADMDFRTARSVQAAIRDSVDTLDYSYPLRDGLRADRAVAQAFVRHMRVMHDWPVDADQVLVLADLVQASFGAVLAFSEPGDGVILQVPNYPPFREAIEHTGRKLIPLPMECHADGYRFNLERLEARIDARARIFLLCNPQNPTGRVFTRAELEQVAAFAERHDLIVVSDEIHADLVHPGSRHVPFASLSPRAAARTITLNSATKSFNIPGLRCGVAHFGSRELMERFHRRIPARLTGAPNNIGIDATAAAWTDDGPWLGAVRDHLLAMRDHACASLRRELPQIRFHVPESTYLLWLDCSALDIGGSAARYFLEHARVGLSPGEQFLPGSQHRVRLNFATSKPILDEILERMASAIRLDGR